MRNLSPNRSSSRSNGSFEPRPARRSALVAAVVAVVLLLGASCAWSQLTISIAYQGPSAPTNGGPVDPGGAYIVWPGSCVTPSLFCPSGAMGLFPAAYNSVEMDALSWGRDALLTATGTGYWGGNYRFFFSTDELASGDPAMGAPTVRSEGAAGNQEASADVQMTTFFMSQPIPPSFYGHTSLYDGDGVGPFGGACPGALVEPNPPGPGIDSGDTLDALDMWAQSSAMRLYFSLDSSWIDPLEGLYGNAGTAAVNGVAPGDVLRSSNCNPFIVWAPAAMLGLGPNDDLDALILRENGNGVFNPSAQPFDWMGGTTDMLLFSVRRGSPVISQPDSQYGMPIEEGDVLTTPCNVAPCVGGPNPAIFIAAENLGLGTVRNGTDAPFVGYGDDLDAMTVR